jgi:predicted ATPase
MIRRIYIHNYKVFQNFELQLSSLPAALLIGKNGAGKTSIASALQLLQQIARGTNRVRELLTAAHFPWYINDQPMRFQIDAELSGRIFRYELAFELPQGFREIRVADERLCCGDDTVYSRSRSQVALNRNDAGTDARFVVDWHLVALPLIQAQSSTDPVSVFRNWLANMLILQPIPSLITGGSSGESPLPSRDAVNLGAWFSELIAQSPAAYTHVDSYIRSVLPDFIDIQNPATGPESRQLMVQFKHPQGSTSLPFNVLSDGEKCFFIAALVIAASAVSKTVFCFWDEPDNYLALSEVSHFIIALRKYLQHFSGQLIITSHNPEAIRRFSNDNTLVIYRNSHAEPAQIRRLADLPVNGDLINALLTDDITP